MQKVIYFLVKLICVPVLYSMYFTIVAACYLFPVRTRKQKSAKKEERLDYLNAAMAHQAI